MSRAGQSFLQDRDNVRGYLCLQLSYPVLPGIAAAYAYHIAEAQAFADGNKRTALAAALTFLELHGIDTAADQDALYAAMIGIATHDLTKAGLADVLRGLFA